MPKIIASSRLPGGSRRAGKYIPDGQVELDVTDAELKEMKADDALVVLVVPDIAAPVQPPPPSADSKKK